MTSQMLVTLLIMFVLGLVFGWHGGVVTMCLLQIVPKSPETPCDNCQADLLDCETCEHCQP